MKCLDISVVFVEREARAEREERERLQTMKVDPDQTVSDFKLTVCGHPDGVPHCRLVHCLRGLPDERTLRECGIRNRSRVYVLSALCGGGNDGGSIPNRGEMVRTKKTQKKSDESLVKRARWLACALTNQPLQQRIVADAFGNVFNKEAILKCLIEKTMPEGFNHIRSIKDVFDLHFTRNLKYDETQQIHVGMEGSLLDSPFECPLTGKPVNGQHAFSALRCCGHVFSDKGLQEILADSNCFVCQKHFSESDIVILNPPEEALFELRLKFLEAIKDKKAERKKEKVKGNKTKEIEGKQKEKEKGKYVDTEKGKGKETEKEKVDVVKEKRRDSKNEGNMEKSKEETKKRKLSPQTDNLSNPKKPKTTPQQPPNVRNVMAVSSSLNQITQSHDLKKQSSNAYKSIFSATPSFAPQYLTGIVKGVIK